MTKESHHSIIESGDDPIVHGVNQTPSPQETSSMRPRALERIFQRRSASSQRGHSKTATVTFV